MTMIDVLWVAVGFLICAALFTIICLLMIVAVWWVFKTNQDIEIEFENLEDE